LTEDRKIESVSNNKTTQKPSAPKAGGFLIKFYSKRSKNK